MCEAAMGNNLSNGCKCLAAFIPSMPSRRLWDTRPMQLSKHMNIIALCYSHVNAVGVCVCVCVHVCVCTCVCVYVCVCVCSHAKC